MSSDSDDEEELLQMALKEQAQRDVNYNKAGRASKPVVNYVQAPPHPSTAAKQRNPNPNPNQRPPATQKGRRGGVEDEDDSEVEMLSISSGDEDSVKDRGVAARSRGAGGRGEKEDGDKGWDGGEPNCWKTVDEAEVRFVEFYVCFPFFFFVFFVGLFGWEKMWGKRESVLLYVES